MKVEWNAQTFVPPERNGLERAFYCRLGHAPYCSTLCIFAENSSFLSSLFLSFPVKFSPVQITPEMMDEMFHSSRCIFSANEQFITVTVSEPESTRKMKADTNAAHKVMLLPRLLRNDEFPIYSGNNSFVFHYGTCSIFNSKEQFNGYQNSKSLYASRESLAFRKGSN